jgi:excisionase family DNA binding protein
MSDETKTQWTIPELLEEARRRGKPVSKEYIRRLCASGKLVATKPGRDWLIPSWAAERWLKRWVEEE